MMCPIILWGLAVAASGSQDDVESLIRRLGAENVDVRDRASRRLEAIGPPAVPALLDAARDPSPEIASRASMLLDEIDAGRRVDRLYPGFRSFALDHQEALTLRKPAACLALFHYLWKEHLRGREFPRPASRDRRFLDSLARRASAGTPSPPERLSLSWAVGRWRLESGARGVARFLRDPEERIRDKASEALQKLNYEVAIPAILRECSPDGANPRWAAEEALDVLAGREPPRSHAVLTGFLHDTDPKVRALTRYSLRGGAIHFTQAQLEKLCGSPYRDISGWASWELSVRGVDAERVASVLDRKGASRRRALRLRVKSATPPRKSPRPDSRD